jgi:D-alanyl-D-alanine carboxypeptidase-like protein
MTAGAVRRPAVPALRRPAVAIAAVALAATLLVPVLGTRNVANAANVSLPPAYLVSRVGGFPANFQTKLEHLSGVRAADVFLEGVAWMTRSVKAGGRIVDHPRAPLAIPLDVMAARAWKMGPFLPKAYRHQVIQALLHKKAVLGSRSARLRGLTVGDRLVFRGGIRVVVGAVVPDPVASWSEALVLPRIARALHVAHPRFALVQFAGRPKIRAVARRVRAVVPPGYPIRVRRPGTVPYRRTSDTAWPPTLMKMAFGEFAARPDPARPGYLIMGAAFIRKHLASRSVPLLGGMTCNRRVFGPLTAAMNDLRRRGLAHLIHSFNGCYNARMVMRRPTWLISKHTWGSAVDINAATNPWGVRPRQDPRLVAVLASHGFTWGGLWTVPDGMHFEYEGVRGIAP